MKLAIMKLGANITFSSSNKSAANADILYFLRQLDISQHDVTIVTHKTRNTFIPKRLKVLELWDLPRIDTFNGYDAIIVFNGSLNFFGGAKDEGILAFYRILSCTNTPIIWVFTDGQLIMKQLWPSIHKREWARNLEESDYIIDGDNVSYLSQFRNKDKTEELIWSKTDHVIPRKIVFYDLARTILAKHEQYIKPNTRPIDERPYDLVYGGATRNTHKRKRIEHYYNDKRLRTMVFGNLRGVSVPNAIMHAKCSYKDFIIRQGIGIATVLIGDKFYEDNSFSLRFYEAILADVVPFIDERLDPNHIFYEGGGADTSWLYINHPTEIYRNTLYGAYERFQFLKEIVFDQYYYEGYQKLLEASIEGCIE